MREKAQLRELCDAAAVTRLLLNKTVGYGRSPARYADSDACALGRQPGQRRDMPENRGSLWETYAAGRASLTVTIAGDNGA